MRYLAVACSYDQTVATDGRIDPATVAGLRRLVASGRHLILVSRRRVEDLLEVLPENLFAWIVAEHGGVLYDPARRAGRPLADPLPDRLVDALQERGVEPLAIGEVSVATDQADEQDLGQAIETTGIDAGVVADKGMAVAVPVGVDKASGLAAALAELELSLHNVVGVGHGVSDLGFLDRCECGVAVANAPSEVADRCDLVTSQPGPAGLVELIDQLVADDLAEVEPRLARRRLLLGYNDDGELAVPAYGANLLLAGPSGAGKSTLAAGLLERLRDQRYQFLVLDPEGDHADLDGVTHLGGRHDPPTTEQLVAALQEDPEQSVVANLLGRRLEDMAGFLRELLRGLQELRTRTGRPHLLMLDEAHHFLPLPGEPDAFVLPRWVDGLLMATVNPEHVSPTALSLADMVVTFGDAASSALERYCQAIGEPPPDQAPVEVPPGQALAFHRTGGGRLVQFEIAGGQTERRPHLRRYAESELDEAKSFYFRGEDGRLRLRAQHLAMFIHLAEGVDDATWLHHLRQGDYSAWFLAATHDEPLAEQAAQIEREAAELPAEESRRRIIAAIQDRYLEGP